MDLNQLSPKQLDENANYQGPGQYLHYKGGEYHVHGIALQEDTVPKADQDNTEIFKPVFYVIYQPLTAGSMLEQLPQIDFWARELSDFNAKVECTTFHDDEGNKYEEEGGYLVRRFVKIPEIDEKDLVYTITRNGVNGRTRVRIAHKPTGLIGDGEELSRTHAISDAIKDLRYKVAYRNASV